MIVNKYGRVAGSIDLAALAEMYAQADDDDLKAHYREVAAENGLDLVKAAELPAVEEQPEPEPESEPEPEDELAELRAQAEALGIRVDGRWGVDRLRQEIENVEEG